MGNILAGIKRFILLHQILGKFRNHFVKPWRHQGFTKLKKLILFHPALRRIARRFVRAWLLQGKQKTPPFSVNVEPTNYCNLICPICPHGAVHAGTIPSFKRVRGHLNLETFDMIIKGSLPYIRTMSLYLHGEPFLNPDLHIMMKRANENNIRVSLFSNGLTLTQERLEEALDASPKSISVSADIISPEGYLRFKGVGFFQEATEKIRMIASVFSERKSKTKLSIRSIYNGENQEALRSFLDTWLSVPGIQSVQVTHPFPWPKWKDADILASRMFENTEDTECCQAWNALNVCWDGTVTPCSFDYEAEYPIGNIKEFPLDEILNSPEARYFRKMHILGKREKISICADCMIPRFNIDVIVVRSHVYAKMNEEKKTELFNRIMGLTFHPGNDFVIRS